MKNPIPPIVHSLNALSHVLDKAEAHCAENKIDPAALLTARLLPDMFTCTRKELDARAISSLMIMAASQPISDPP